MLLILIAAVGLLPSMAGCQTKRWPLWQGYSSMFIDAQGRVVDHESGDRTTSEGQSYAMFFSLVANDQKTFDQVLAWTGNNLAAGDLTSRLPAWKWGKAADGQWKVIDPHSASDADLWIAYSLLEAGRLWQRPLYTALGKSLAARIAEREVTNLPGFGDMLLPGEIGFHPDANTWVLNPSYLPMPLLTRMATLDPNGPWARVAANAPRFLNQSTSHGFAMDWVSYRGRQFIPVASPGQTDSAEPAGSYDAIRVYLWAGMTNTAAPGRSGVLRALSGMSNYLGSHPVPPERTSAEGSVLRANGPIGFSAAVVPFLESVGANGALEEQEALLSAGKDPSTALYGQQPTYYDQNLAMFGEGWAAGRFSFAPDGELRVKWKRS